MAESLDLTLGEQIGEPIRPDRLALRRVESHHLPVTHVVPIIKCHEESTVRYKKLNGCNRIEQGSSRCQSVRPILFKPIKLRCGKWPLGRSTKSDSVAKTLARKYADEIGARVAEHLPDHRRGPVVSLSDWQSGEGEGYYWEPHT